MDQNQKARSVQRGVSAHYPHLEKLMYTWFLNQRKAWFSVSTSDLITKALQMKPNLTDVPFCFLLLNPEIDFTILLHSKLHEYELPYRPSPSQRGPGLGEIR